MAFNKYAKAPANAEGMNTLGHEAWNMADSYSKIMILKILVELVDYEKMAKYGYIKPDDMLPPEMIPERRLEGLSRYHHALQQLMDNTRFALKKKMIKLIIAYRERLDQVGEYLDKVAIYESNQNTHETSLRINEEVFNVVYGILRKIKEQLNYPINDAGLIFRQNEGEDIEKIMKELIEDG